MMDKQPLIIFTLIFLIMMSAYFSATETAFSSLNKIRLKHLTNSGHERAQQVLNVLKQYDQLLSTILIGNNIVNILSASLATILFTTYFPKTGVSISTLVMTILILIFGEISPKSLAREVPEKWAMLSMPLLKFFIIILSPLNFIFTQWKKLLSNIFSFDSSESITPEEIKMLIDEAKHNGNFSETESKLIKSAIEFNQLCADDILTPRVQLIAINLDTSKETIQSLFYTTGFSRLPVYQENIDHIIGILHEKDFNLYKDLPTYSLSQLIKPIIYKTANSKISKLLLTFQQTQTQLDVISDEYGGTLGIVTLEDILEVLVGDIWDEHDTVIHDYKQLNENTYLFNGQTSLTKLSDTLNIKIDADCNSVNGWIINELGYIPKVDEIFNFKNLTIKILNSDSRQVTQIKIIIN